MSDFDFSFLGFEDTETAEVRVRAPHGPTDMYVTLAGPEHPAHKKIQFNKARRMSAELSKTGKLPKIDPEENEAEKLDMLVACTLGWRGCPVQFSQAAARALYQQKPYVRDQLFDALNERELFTRASVQS